MKERNYIRVRYTHVIKAIVEKIEKNTNRECVRMTKDFPRPCFFIQTGQTKVDNYGRYYNTQIPISIFYFSEEDNDKSYEDMLEMKDTMTDLFVIDNKIVANTIPLYIEDIEMITDNRDHVLVTMFTIDVEHEKIEDETDLEYMENLTLDLNSIVDEIISEKGDDE